LPLNPPSTNATDNHKEPLDDHAIAAQVATAAGELLMALRADLVAQGAPRWAIEQQGDAQAHRLCAQALAKLAPGDALLSEEGTDDPVRLGAERTWIVDPLDGTREYGEYPRRDFAVHVALVKKNRPVAAAVALPAVGVTYQSGLGLELPQRDEGPPRMVVSRSRPPHICYLIAEAIGAELIPMGSAGAKAMAVVSGEADIYAHAGGQYEWDSCAPVGVANAVGLYTARLDGAPLLYNQPDPWLPDFLICRPEYTDDILAVVHQHFQRSTYQNRWH